MEAIKSLFMGNKKIVIIQPNLNVGGSQNMAKLYHEALEDSGHEVYRLILTGNKNSNYPNLIFLEKNRSLSSIVKLNKILLKIRPDSIIVFQFQANLIISLVKFFQPKVNYRYILRESNMQNYLLKSKWKKLILRWVYYNSNVIIAQCLDMKKHLIYNFKVDESKIKIVHNYTNYKPGKSIEKRRNFLLVASTLSNQKNIYSALDFWHKQNTKEEFHIYGYNNKRFKQLKNYIKLKEINNVILKGKIVPIPYSNYRYLIVNSYFEGFSNAVLESLASGTPVLSRLYEGGIEEVISKTNGGILTNELNSIQLQEIMHKKWDYDALVDNLNANFNYKKFKYQCNLVVQ